MIPRVSSTEFELDFLGKNQPVIITDALSGWNISEFWNPSNLATIIGSKNCIVNISKERRYNDRETDLALKRDDGILMQRQTMGFSDAISMMHSRSATFKDMYIMQQPVQKNFPELMSNIDMPKWIDRRETNPNIWIGNNTTTPLHFDGANNMFAQVFGRKNFTIFSPCDTPYLYLKKYDADMPHISGIDVDNADVGLHPQYKNSNPIRFVMKSGDLLYLPAFWWHHVKSIGMSISVNFWWRAQFDQIANSRNSPSLLCRLYQEDRLVEFESTYLTSCGLDLKQASRQLLGLGMHWVAGILALAAFDRALAERYGFSRRSRGCPIGDLSAQLIPICAQLRSSGVVSLDEGRLVEEVPLLARRIAYCDETQVDGEKITQLLDFLQNNSKRAFLV